MRVTPPFLQSWASDHPQVQAKGGPFTTNDGRRVQMVGFLATHYQQDYPLLERVSNIPKE